MLVTRQCDTGRNTWSSGKFKADYSHGASPRMSNFEPLQPQSDWREQYPPYNLTGEHELLSPSYEQPHDSNDTNNQQHERSGNRPQLEHRHSLNPLRQDTQAVIIERPGSAPTEGRDPALLASESKGLHLGNLGSNPLSSASGASQQQATQGNNDGEDAQADMKDEEDDEDDDDDMLDAEEVDGEGEGNGSVPQTAAERRAERRKMKRFRLTHQQTRFLMSEFAKQAHPDAAHRERLSREIPGLSPRQVQVWFQNRRAKIKRLTADDRDRMMKMRAVPDDFDNVQALHSPYGATHPLHSPVDFVPGYTDHMMRPLMVDTMRRHDEHISPTGLSPAFSHVGFVGSPDVLSPLSMTSQDRYYGHGQGNGSMPSPMSAGSRGAFERQNSANSGFNQALSQSRQNMRALQPLQLRETMSRSRSDSLQSPLRTSMSWTGDKLDYGGFQQQQQQGGQPSQSPRQQSMYQPEQTYEGNTHPNTNASLQSSPTRMAYSPQGGPSTSLQQSSPAAMSRLRASSAAFPPGLELRTQFRGIPSQQQQQQQTQHSGLPHTPRSSSFSGIYASNGYASAPLTAPGDFTLPRTPVENGPARDLNGSQSSAPMQPPQDFQNAYNATVGSGRGSQAEGHIDGGGQQQQSRNGDGSSFLRPMEYDAGHKRKRSFTLPGSFQSS